MCKPTRRQHSLHRRERMRILGDEPTRRIVRHRRPRSAGGGMASTVLRDTRTILVQAQERLRASAKPQWIHELPTADTDERRPGDLVGCSAGSSRRADFAQASTRDTAASSRTALIGGSHTSVSIMTRLVTTAGSSHVSDASARTPATRSQTTYRQHRKSSPCDRPQHRHRAQP